MVVVVVVVLLVVLVVVLLRAVVVQLALVVVVVALHGLRHQTVYAEGGFGDHFGLFALPHIQHHRATRGNVQRARATHSWASICPLRAANPDGEEGRGDDGKKESSPTNYFMFALGRKGGNTRARTQHTCTHTSIGDR